MCCVLVIVDLNFAGLIVVSYEFFFFFFQAEDGIRDLIVTGVQTCALPISALPGSTVRGGAPIPPTVDPGRAEQTRPMASRSFVQWRAPPGRHEPRPLHGV